MQRSLFVGGCYRSGTTLLEKLLHHHPELSVASQPFPDLYFYCKSLFLAERGLVRRYPLGHLFMEDGYTREEFSDFLNLALLTDQDLAVVFEQMKENRRGLWTPEILQFEQGIQPGRFIDVYSQLNRMAAGLLGRRDALYLGGKEVLCEEYVPHILSSGGKAILVVRDPRDMITSLHFGTRDTKTGEDRPVLFSLRQWRKSVAYCLGLEENPNFMWLRYEDIVSEPMVHLSRTSVFLGVSSFREAMLKGGVRHQDGSPWKGNSSFSDQYGVTASSVGRFEGEMPPEVVAFIEACCGPEMKRLGYQKTRVQPDPEKAILEYRDPFERIHAKFPADYSHQPWRLEQEISRLQLLREGVNPSREEQRRFFLFEHTWRELAGRSKSHHQELMQ